MNGADLDSRGPVFMVWTDAVRSVVANRSEAAAGSFFLTWLDFDVAHFPVRMGYKRLALSLAVMVYAPELSSAAPIAF